MSPLEPFVSLSQEAGVALKPRECPECNLELAPVCTHGAGRDGGKWKTTPGWQVGGVRNGNLHSRWALGPQDKQISISVHQNLKVYTEALVRLRQ